ncbi:MAG: hypothetical protein GY754_14940, partial [bacterium]|nr:hypothetical protein [bacterium]
FDFATYNVVARNRFYKFTPQQAIRHGYPNVDIPNYFYQNARSDGAQPRPSMCYATNHNKNYINHGESTDKYYRNRGSCKTYTYTCNDGYLKRVSKKNGCAGRKMRFDCKVSGSNGGCSKTVSCPAGKRVINVAAACNLEYGDANAYNVPIDRLRVTRTSDYVQQGYCYVNSTRIQRKEARISIPKMRRGKYSSRRNSITVGCREHDKNGGDCHITGYLYCK